jgi:hypothetical protein
MRRSMLVFVCCLAAVFTGLILSGYAEAAPGRGRSAAKDLLPAALKNIDIKDDFVAGDGKEAGVIQAITGHAVVARQDLRQAYFAATGDRLYEKDVLFTLKDSRCRFRMHNEDVVTLGEATRLGITAFVDDRNTQEKRSSFGMTKGKAMFYTLRLLKHKQAGMDVTTPTAVAGVRGTKFGMEVNETDGSTYSYAYEGSIYVTSTVTGETRTMPEGQGIKADAVGLGVPFAIPPALWRQFQLDTSIGPSDAIGLGTEGSAAGTDEPPLAAVGVDTTTLTQNLNAPAGRPTCHEGYFVGMLSRDLAGWIYNGTHISDTLQDFDSSNARAPDDINFVRVDGTGGSTKQIAELYVNTYYATGLPQPMQRTELGYNAYMEWGSWTQPTLMTDAGFNVYRFDNKGYYVWGDVTTNEQMAALAAANLVATYSGSAYGTYYTNTGGTDMTGTFGTTVNFHTGQLNNFGINVAGGGNTVTLTGGTGNFTGGTSQFDINGGAWSINGGTDAGSAYGSVYGGQAQAIGGVWQANGGAGQAAGMFQGTR